MQPTELKFRNIPDQTAVIQLAYAAYSLGQQKPTQQPRGPAPLQPAVLPMDRSLRSALQSLYTQLDHQYVRSIPTGPVNIHEAISHQLDGEDAPNSDINATLPPHPTKLKRDGTPRGSPKRDSCTRPVETSARRLPSRPAQPGPCTTQPQQDVLPNMVPEVPS